MNMKLKKLSRHSEGQVVLLIHGWGMNSYVWRPLVEAMPDYCFYGLDLPGHGANVEVDCGDDIESWLALANEAVQKMGAHRFHIMGWSLGGMMATKIALTQVAICQSLTLLASNPKFVASSDWPHAMPAHYLSSFMQNLQQDIAKTVREFMELQVRGAQHAAGALEQLLELVEKGGLADAQGLKNGLSVLQKSDVRTGLSELNCSVNIVLGKRDTLVPVGVVDELQALCANAQIHILPKSGHAPFVSHTDETAALLRAFWADA